MTGLTRDALAALDELGLETPFAEAPGAEEQFDSDIRLSAFAESPFAEAMEPGWSESVAGEEFELSEAPAPPASSRKARPARAAPRAASSGLGPSGRRLPINDEPLLKSHGGPPPNLILRWANVNGSGPVDVVVHFHGYSWEMAGMRLDLHKEPISGLDFADPAPSATPGRSRPTLAILPRGKYVGDQPDTRKDKYVFPALTRKGSLVQLVTDSLARLGRETGHSFTLGRLILTGHSGGGAPLSTVLAHPDVDPDEVHIYDGMYSAGGNILAWAKKRVARELAAPGTLPPALRVQYNPKSGTEAHSKALARALCPILAPAPAARLRPFFRVDRTAVGHNQIPESFGWRLLADAAADLPGATTLSCRRAASARKASEQEAIGMGEEQLFEADEALDSDEDATEAEGWTEESLAWLDVEAAEAEAEALEPPAAEEEWLEAEDAEAGWSESVAGEDRFDGAGQEMLAEEHEDELERDAEQYSDELGEPESAFSDECGGGSRGEQEAGEFELYADEAAPAQFADEFLEEAWSGNADQIAFRDRVLARHIARSKAARGAPLRDLRDDELQMVPGTTVRTLPDTATAAGRLLAAANSDLARAKGEGDADARRTIRLTATSGYRGSAHQRRLWLDYFSAKDGYYDQTRTARESFPEGPHSDRAIDYMLKRKSQAGFGLTGRIAAPGYSNHQNGIAIDFFQERDKRHYIANKSKEASRLKWRRTWFHRWLKANAATYGFVPIPTEEWHWEYRRKASSPAGQAAEGETASGLQSHELDPSLLDIAERVMARELPLLGEQPTQRWTRCFSAADVAKVEKVYQDNAGAAGANGVDRCSCIVMLNVALGQLLSLPLKTSRARGASARTVQMGALTTKSIEKAMEQLRAKGYATAPIALNFLDRRNRTAGTLRPERLKTSVQAKVLDAAKTKGCWFAFGLSIMDGYHSVLLLVDRTGATARIYWLDQFSAGVTDDVTSGLDQRITDKTQAWWQGVMDSKGKGYNTTIRLWPLRKRRKT